jgi:hypothetical protein
MYLIWAPPIRLDDMNRAGYLVNHFFVKGTESFDILELNLRVTSLVPALNRVEALDGATPDVNVQVRLALDLVVDVPQDYILPVRDELTVKGVLPKNMQGGKLGTLKKMIKLVRIEFNLWKCLNYT